jgi:hypothetical protein
VSGERRISARIQYKANGSGGYNVGAAAAIV